MQRKNSVDTKRAAEHLGVEPITLKVWRCKGKGPAYHKLGNRVTYDIPDLDAYKQAHRVEPGAS